MPCRSFSRPYKRQYINTFSKYNQNYQVRVQAAERYRSTADNLLSLRVPNGKGEEVPLAGFASVQQVSGPSIVTRYNLYSSASMQGSAAPGVSTGASMKAMEEIAGRVLPQGFGYEWTGMSFQEEKSHGQAAIAVGLAILLVYLILAALYANWILPLGVLLVIPLALFGTVAAIMLRGMDNNIYVQIGMLLLIAMSSKNALILVLYARRYGEQGMTAMQAAHKAASVRFRPILMPWAPCPCSGPRERARSTSNIWGRPFSAAWWRRRCSPCCTPRFSMRCSWAFPAN